jgi:para-aminobenzoate synthetase component 1
VPYAFPSVWQLVSSVSGELRPEKDWVEALKMCFPMGSMTGAPKIAAMDYIEQFEQTQRGVYSGALGYISPENDFDFNVLIRSFIYNTNNNYLSWQVGGAIVADSEPLEEYEECLTKIRPLLQTLEKLTKKNPQD